MQLKWLINIVSAVKKYSIAGMVMLAFLSAPMMLNADDTVSLNPGDTPPSFMYFDSAGEKITLEKYAGVQPVVISFFATYCVPCKKEIPYLAGQSAKGTKFKLILVVADTGDEEAVTAYLKKAKTDLPYIYDPSGKLIKDFNPVKYPFTVFIGKSGNIAAVKTGFSATTKKEYTEIFKQLEEK